MADFTKTSAGNSGSATKKRLLRLAETRGAKVEARTIRLYSEGLAGFADDVVAQVCDQFEAEMIDQYTPRWPALEALRAACRKLQNELTGVKEPKFFCEDCASECGMLFFDKPRGGRRLRGVELVTAEKRYARPCPCGGTETDWMALEIDRGHNPQNYRQAPKGVQSVYERARVQGQ